MDILLIVIVIWPFHRTPTQFLFAFESSDCWVVMRSDAMKNLPFRIWFLGRQHSDNMVVMVPTAFHWFPTLGKSDCKRIVDSC